jgi:hypothetical protein
MDTLAHHNEKKPFLSKGLIVGILIGILAVAGLVGVLLLRPSVEDQKSAALEGAFREGSAEFETLRNDLVFADKDTIESPNAFGSISMYIQGEVRNKGTRVINALEVNVAVIDQKNQVLKDKNVLVVPSQQRATFEPGEVIPLTTTLDGFGKKDDRANIRWTVTAVKAAP